MPDETREMFLEEAEFMQRAYELLALCARWA